MANFSQTDFSHALKSKNRAPSESIAGSSTAADFGGSGALPKTGAALRTAGVVGGGAGVLERAGIGLGATGPGVTGGATGGIGGAMGGIDVESEVFCDTLEPQRID